MIYLVRESITDSGKISFNMQYGYISDATFDLVFERIPIENTELDWLRHDLRVLAACGVRGSVMIWAEGKGRHDGTLIHFTLRANNLYESQCEVKFNKAVRISLNKDFVSKLDTHPQFKEWNKKNSAEEWAYEPEDSEWLPLYQIVGILKVRSGK